MEIILKVGCCCHESRPKRKAHFDFRIGAPQPKTQEKKMLEIDLTTEQKVQVTLKPVTATGKPAKLDGVPTWTVVSGGGSGQNVVAAEDGLSAFLISNDEPGDIDVQVEADADLGEGVETLTDIIRLHVAGAKAENLGLVAGTPEPK